MCKFKDTNLGIKKLDFNVKRGMTGGKDDRPGEWAATTGAWAHGQAARTELQKFFFINNIINNLISKKK